MTDTHAQDRTQTADFLATFEAFKAANDERLGEIERKSSADVLLSEKVDRIDQALHRQKAALDRLALDRARPSVSAEPLSAPSERKAAFDRYLRRGDPAGLLERKDLSSGTPADGGYVVNAELEAAIARRLEVSSPMRAIASIRQISAGTY